MATTREYATLHVQMHAATSVTPALTDAEVDFCIDQALLPDIAGRPPGAIGYIETVWATRAVYVALKSKIAKARNMIDFTADGNTQSQAQIVANLIAERNAVLANMFPGTI